MDDLISRAAACECIGKMIHEYREKGEDDLADGMILARRYGIKRLPAVDAAPVVHGRWVDEKGNPVPWCDALPSSPAYNNCWCNQCGTWLVASDVYPVYGLFCPACGAKMDGERRESE